MDSTKRRNYLINKTFQFKMMIVSIIVAIPFLVFLYVIHTALNAILLNRLEALNQQTAEMVLSLMGEIEGSLKILISIGIALVAFINMIFFLFLSHAIAGPIEKLKAHLKRKSNNEDTGPFVMRTSDFFPELQDVVNECFKDLVPKTEKEPQ